MRFKLFIITIIAFIAAQSVSTYNGVSWNKHRNEWQAKFFFKGYIFKSKFYFKHELDAAERIYQFCEIMEIPQQNPKINKIPNQKTKGKTSHYRGVSWHKNNKKWIAQSILQGKLNYCGTFNDELDAAKRVNQLCKEHDISLKNPEIGTIPNQQCAKEKTSQYSGVCWNEKLRKWKAQIRIKSARKTFGGCYKDEQDAAKRVNQLCEEFGIPIRNPEISGVPNEQRTKILSSQYKGVSWHSKTREWYAQLQVKGKKKYGGTFKDELDAAKRVNQLCEELGIPFQNPTISAKPNKKKEKNEKTSRFKGIHWHKRSRKWLVQIHAKGQNYKYGGMFKDELDAAKRANQLCEELGIPLRNPEIGAKPKQQYQKKEKTSQYKGVTWQKERGKWFVQVSLKGEKPKYGGCFEDELDAAKRVNQLCQKLGIPIQNHEIETNVEDCKTLLDYNAIQAEFEDLIRFLHRDNYPAALNIKKAIIGSIRHGEKTNMSEINLQTKNGESALSIAAKHGFSNVVKFLISKGADKEHFTNEHHTPLSLAVSQNHLKVVQVLLEDWMSPNCHEEPYLHLSPIFYVKSKEIAQLLIDNDAVTHEIYNVKNQSPLTVACQNGYLDVVEFFLDDGLHINHLDNDNKTPLFYALTNKHEDVAKLLILKGAQK